MKYLKFLLPLAIFLGLAAFLAAGLKLDPKEVPSPLINKASPAFQLTRLDDPASTIRRDDLMGKVWVLNVWASWCVACQAEHPLLVEFASKKMVPIYGLNYKDERVAGLRWLSRYGNPYTASLFDEDGRVGVDWGVYGVPETFVMGRQGCGRSRTRSPNGPDHGRTAVPGLPEPDHRRLQRRPRDRPEEPGARNAAPGRLG